MSKIIMQNFQELSYRLHTQFFTETSEESKTIQQSWFDENTVDYWRHSRMVRPLTQLLRHFPYAECVTVGDGRFGLDSVRLKKLEPTLRILPTDIAPNLLQKAKDQNIIYDFRVENAENLSFSDEYFDFSFCIESYHHFPRPFIALYEMLRISSKAVILIEPNDKFPKQLPRKIYDLFKNTVQKIFKNNHHHHEHLHFEESGNYIFTVSKRELEKIAIGLQLPMVAFYYFNDYYEKGVEFEKLSSQSKLFKKVKRKINLSNLKCELGLSN